MESITPTADLLAQGRCQYCVPSSCIAALPGTTWRPLTEPASYYPWSVLWRATEISGHVHAVVSCARAMSQRLGLAGGRRPGPCRKRSRISTGSAQVIADPGAPDCFTPVPLRRPLRSAPLPARRLTARASSPDGGIDQFRELRATARSKRATRAASNAIS